MAKVRATIAGLLRYSGKVWGCLVLLVLLAGSIGVARAAPPVPPPPSSLVTDEAGVLSPGLRSSLARRLDRYQSEGGHQIVVWIGTSSELPIEDLAVEAFEQWKVGDAKLDDGLALFVLVEDRTLRIEVGYGLEPTVTDLVASQVIRSVMIPRIAAGDWDGAIVGGVEALVDTIEGSPGSLPADTEGPAAEDWRAQGVLGWLEVIGIALAVIAFLVLLATHPRLALELLFIVGRGMGGGGHRRGGGGGGFHGGGGLSGGGGATGRW